MKVFFKFSFLQFCIFLFFLFFIPRCVATMTQRRSDDPPPRVSPHTVRHTEALMPGVEGLDGKRRDVLPAAPPLTGHTVVLCLQQSEERGGWMFY